MGNKKKKVPLILFSLSAFVTLGIVTLMTLAATGVISLVKERLHIVFRNYDHTFLYETDVYEGETAIYDGPIPEKPRDDENFYVFNGWDHDLKNINEEFDAIALFSTQGIGAGGDDSIEIGGKPDINGNYGEDGEGSSGGGGTAGPGNNDNPGGHGDGDGPGDGSGGEGNGGSGSGDSGTGDGGSGGGGGGGGGSGGEGKPRLLMIVKSPSKEKIYLRQDSYGEYYHSSWTRAPKYPMNELASGELSPLSYATEVAKTKIGSNPINIEYVSEFVHYPVPQYNLDFNIHSKNDSYGLEDIEIPKYDSTYLYFDWSKASLDALKSVELNENQKRARQEYNEFAKKYYTYVKEDNVRDIDKFINKHNFSSSDPNLFSNMVEELNKDKKFNPMFADYPLGIDPISYFLNESKEGDSMHFASVITLALRRLGFASRFVYGYVANNKKPGQPTPVMNSDHLYWSEVYLEDIGWVAINTIKIRSDFDSGDDGMIDFSTTDYVKVYDGFPYEVDIFVNPKLLKRGDYLVVDNRMMMPCIDAGTYNISYDCKILNSDGNDVTIQYEYIPESVDCTLTILPRPLEIITPSFEGHLNEEGYCYNRPEYIEIGGDGLAYFDSLNVNLPVFNNYGEFENIATIDDVNISGRTEGNLVRNYTIDFTYGKVLITP